ncbi:translocation/assembly module TamB domain-containing protein [Jhaorihella thermophila]
MGQIELIRGTLSLLSRRMRLTKGVISLQGGLNPYVEFASSTSTDEGTATIEISGPMNAPEVKVFAEPERPAEEALAMLLFGNRFSQMSPLVIAQMAASLARLGSGDAATQGVKKATGVDTISVGEDETGAPSVTVGGYLSENIYTDVTVNTQGETELNLNLDLNENLRARGTVDNAGDTALGLFFQRDY